MIKVFGVGRFAKDAESFNYSTSNGNKVGTRAQVICNTSTRDQDGEYETVYLHLTFWYDLAQYFQKGNQISFEGELRQSADANGTIYTNINVNNFEFGAVARNNNQSQNNSQNYQEKTYRDFEEEQY